MTAYLWRNAIEDGQLVEGIALVLHLGRLTLYDMTEFLLDTYTGLLRELC